MSTVSVPLPNDHTVFTREAAETVTQLPGVCTTQGSCRSACAEVKAEVAAALAAGEVASPRHAQAVTHLNQPPEELL